MPSEQYTRRDGEEGWRGKGMGRRDRRGKGMERWLRGGGKGRQMRRESRCGLGEEQGHDMRSSPLW